MLSWPWLFYDGYYYFNSIRADDSKLAVVRLTSVSAQQIQHPIKIQFTSITKYGMPMNWDTNEFWLTGTEIIFLSENFDLGPVCWKSLKNNFT